MKRIINILTVALISAFLSYPSAEAQSRSGRGSAQATHHKNASSSTGKQEHGSKNVGSQNHNVQSARPASGAQKHNNGITPSKNARSEQTSARPANKGNLPNNGATNRPNNSGYTRPGNGGKGHDNNNATRPGNNGNSRPDNNGASARPNNNGNNRPNNSGNNKPGNNAFRPDNGPGHGMGNQQHGKPGTPPPPAYGYGPGGDRWHGNFHDIPHHAPHRPMLPPPPPHFYRPVPPPAFRPVPHGPHFTTILGVALGSAINYTVNQLFNSGYYVTGYTNNAIYLNDVLMLNMVWPNVTLQYTRGLLSGSEFVYPSAYYNTDIYYQVYNSLQSSYGVPVTMNYLSGGGMQATWFGVDGRFVNLTFQAGTAIDGQLRYYTTLSFGN